MLPKERVIAALEHREPDRVPTGEIAVDYELTEATLGRQTLYRAKWRETLAMWNDQRDEIVENYKNDIVALARIYGWDYVPVILVPPKNAKDKLPPFLKPELLDEHTWRDGSGRTYKYSPSTGAQACVGYPPSTSDDLSDNLPIIDDSELELVHHVVEELGDTHFIIGKGTDYSRRSDGCLPTYLCGFEELLMRIVLDPDYVEQAVTVSTRQSIAVNDALIRAGCDAVLSAVDLADNTGPFMSPKHFEQFVLPSIGLMAEAVHKKGKYFIKHTDGNTWLILEMMVEAGIDGWHGIQPSIGMDMRRLKEQFHGRLCLFGGVNCETLIDGTVSEVRDEVEYSISHAGPGGGLVLGSGNSLMVGTKKKNYEAMLDALHELGHYPLSTTDGATKQRDGE